MLTVSQASRLKELIWQFGSANYREGEYLHAYYAKPGEHKRKKELTEIAYDKVFGYLAELTKEE